jgi:hypothetical protein
MKLLLCACFATALQAAEVSGKWAGTAEFVNRDARARSTPILIALKQSGDDITGTAGPTGEMQQEIRNGKVAGDKLKFEIADPGGTAVVELTIGEGTLKGEAKGTREYGVVTMKLDLKRE